MLSSRRVKPQLEDYDVEITSDLGSESDSEKQVQAGKGPQCESSDEDDQSSPNPEEAVADTRAALASIPFSTLAKAQSTISKNNETQEGNYDDEPASGMRRSLDRRRKKSAAKRSSKDAPQEISAKRAVTRKREVLAPRGSPSKLRRDPRFDNAVTGSHNEKIFHKNYAFLEEYRNSEVEALKTEMRRTRDEMQKAKLAERLKSMMSRIETQRGKDQTQEVLREHKKKERELIKRGKMPFHLKRSAVKRMVLEKKYDSLTERQLEKTLERRNKRKAQKERKNMPWSRRQARPYAINESSLHSQPHP